MGKFTYIDPNGISLFQRSLDTIRATKRAEKEPRMSEPTTSMQAFDTMALVAKRLVSSGQARDFASAVDVLRSERHPTYTAWVGGSAPATTPVVKTAVPAQIQKRTTVMAEITKRASALVRSGQAANEEEARSQLFKADRALYNEYRDASYAAGPAVPPALREGFQALEHGPVYEQVRALAAELKADDLYGKYVGLDEPAMMQEVFRMRPSLWKAYREEVMGPGEEAPKKP